MPLVLVITDVISSAYKQRWDLHGRNDWARTNSLQLGRLGQMEPFEPDAAWWQQLFAVIDARDALGFAQLLTPDAQFRFGNAPTVAGTEAIRTAASGFFASIASCR